jgi:hypothetical protein
MSDNAKSTRTWREIAEEAFREKDREKLLRLTAELEEALAKEARFANSNQTPSEDETDSRRQSIA